MTVLPRNSSARFAVLFFFFSAFMSAFSQASDNDPGKVIAGWVERIAIPDIEGQFKAKLDTGAKTSSIYADKIEVFEKDGDKWVRFELVLEDVEGDERRIRLERERSRRVKIKNHDGDHDSRVSVDLDMCFDGRKRTIEFTLADRREYIYSILLGRRFLEDVAVVDSDETYLTRASCKSDE